MSFSGGCQCGAIRFKAQSLGRPSICHCRMCQKATGGFFGPYVDAMELEWTRGAPKYFKSSDTVSRGFCRDCGTPLSFEGEGWPVNIAIGAFDDPCEIAPVLQIGLESKLAYLDGLHDLPTRPAAEAEALSPYYAAIVSRQHPDHDTESWTPRA